jgi:hypothetical protein
MILVSASNTAIMYLLAHSKRHLSKAFPIFSRCYYATIERLAFLAVFAWRKPVCNALKYHPRSINYSFQGEWIAVAVVIMGQCLRNVGLDWAMFGPGFSGVGMGWCYGGSEVDGGLRVDWETGITGWFFKLARIIYRDSLRFVRKHKLLLAFIVATDLASDLLQFFKILWLFLQFTVLLNYSLSTTILIFYSNLLMWMLI